MSRTATDLSLADARTFLTVARTGAMAVVARELRVTTSQVTKAVDRAERYFGKRLVIRGRRGTALTSFGEELVPRLEAWLTQLDGLRNASLAAPPLTLAGPAYLCQQVGAWLTEQVAPMRLRCVELPFQLIRSGTLHGSIQLVFHQASTWKPEGWGSERIGEVASGLFARPSVARRLGRRVTPDRLVEETFVVPVFLSQGAFVRGTDDCPLPFERRRLGHEASSFPLGLEMAARSDQLVFGPRPFAKEWVRQGLLEEVRVPGWNVSTAVFLACDGDRVTSGLFRKLVELSRRRLKEAAR